MEGVVLAHGGSWAQAGGVEGAQTFCVFIPPPLRGSPVAPNRHTPSAFMVPPPHPPTGRRHARATIHACRMNFDVCCMTIHAGLSFGVHLSKCFAVRKQRACIPRHNVLEKNFRSTGTLMAMRKNRPLVPLTGGGGGLLARSGPQGGWGTQPPLYGPQNGCTEQRALWARRRHMAGENFFVLPYLSMLKILRIL